MRTTTAGKKAEKAVAELLGKRGFKILGQNWKTPVCEIDIIAQRDKVAYFIEVKFRSSESQGGGWEYIGPQKLRKIDFAARVWIQHHRWEGDYRLLAAEVAGLNFEDISIIEIG